MSTISELYPNAIKADGFDDCIIGVDDSPFQEIPRIVYSKERMIHNLIRNGMDYEGAIEYLYFNVWGAYVGPQTPIYVDDMITL